MTPSFFTTVLDVCPSLKTKLFVRWISPLTSNPVPVLGNKLSFEFIRTFCDVPSFNNIKEVFVLEEAPVSKLVCATSLLLLLFTVNRIPLVSAIPFSTVDLKKDIPVAFAPLAFSLNAIEGKFAKSSSIIFSPISTLFKS